jgi:hypothetical protein
MTRVMMTRTILTLLIFLESVWMFGWTVSHEKAVVSCGKAAVSREKD